jgi:hypothetical protein
MHKLKHLKLNRGEIMKKFFILLGLMIVSFGLITTPTYAAETDPIEEPITEEVVEDELTLEEEEALFQAELSATIAEVFAWIGGFSGLGALLLFALRFIRERGVLKAIRDEVKSARESGDSSTLAVNKLVEVVQTYSKREQAMEKMVIGLIQVSDLHPEAKRQIIEGLQNDSITVQDVFAAGLIQANAEIQQNAQIKTEIKQTTASLLSKLAEKDKV